MKLKSTFEIFSSPWQDYSYKVDHNNKILTKIPHGWLKKDPMTIEDVVMWEELYYQGGNLGIYVSWSPHAEFYMIVHDLFLKEQYGIETFFGKNAYLECVLRARKFGIDLDINRIRANENDTSHLLEGNYE